jgi:hypothetical protein
MAYSMNDLKNMGNSINEHFEHKSEQRGKELANNLLDNTSNGRGLWFIITWPAWLLIFVFSGSFFQVGIQRIFSVEAPISWVGFIGAYILAVSWYKWDYTLRHPFLSSIVGYFGTAMSVLFLADKFGW